MAQGSHRHALSVTVVAQHLETDIGDAHWAISIGLSAVLWISIPAAASIVAPQKRKRTEEMCAEGRGGTCPSMQYLATPMPTLLHVPGCNLGERYRGAPMIVHYWADLQSVHGFRCYGNIIMRLMRNVSEDASTRRMAG